MARAGLSNKLKISANALLNQKLWLKQIVENSCHTLYIGTISPANSPKGLEKSDKSRQAD